MRSPLASTLLFHWMVVFAALALVCALEPEAGLRAPLGFLGMNLGRAEGDLALQGSAVFGSGFLLSAVLYLWAFLAVVTGEAGAPETTRAAFATAVVVLTALFAACAFRHVDELAATVALLLAATLVSYLVIASEGSRAMVPEAFTESTSTARTMAADAAHTSSMRGKPGYIQPPEGKT